MSRVLLTFLPLTACLLCVPGSELPARVGADSVEVAGRAAAFLKPSLTGSVTAAIVYDPGDAGSEEEARSIERSLAHGLNVGSMTLRPRRISTGALDQLAGSKVAFVTRGTNYRTVGSATASRSILTISFDPSCARDGYCVMAVGSGARVQILVSRSASRAANVRFNSSFLMLVKEI